MFLYIRAKHVTSVYAALKLFWKASSALYDVITSRGPTQIIVVIST